MITISDPANFPLNISSQTTTNCLSSSESQSLNGREETEVAITMPVQAYEPSITSLKNASFLRKTCAFLIFAALGIFTSLRETSLEESLDQLFLIASYSFIYIIFEDIVILNRTQLSPECRKEYIFNTLDWILLLYFFSALEFQENENVGKCLILAAPILSFVGTAVYIKLSIANYSWKNTKVLLRVLITAQSTLIAAKLTGHVNYEWMALLMPFVIYFGCYAIHGLYATIKSFSQILRHRSQGEPFELVIIASLLKTSWYVLYYGLYLLGIAIGISICSHGDGFRETIRLLLRFTGYYSSFLLGYTFAFIKFVQKFNVNVDIHSSEEDFESFQEFIVEEPESEHSLKAQENPSTFYFKKASSTYFIKIDQELFQDSKSTVASDLTISEIGVNQANETLCYICEIHQANTILSDCGHAGMCIDCAKESLVKKNSCMQCRRPVKSIYQIEKEDKINGHVEASEVFTIVC